MRTKVERYELEKYVMELAALGYGCRDISFKIKSDKDLDISHNSIATYLKSNRKERAEVTKAVVREKIKDQLPNDLDLLDEGIKELTVMFRNPLLLPSDKLKVWDGIRKTIDTKLKYSGAGEPDELQIEVTLEDSEDE